MVTPKQGTQPWVWFYEKVLPPLIVMMCAGIAGGLWATYNAVQSMTIQVSQHEGYINQLRRDVEVVQSLKVQVAQNERDITQLKNEVAIVRAGYMTRIEVLEAIKRIELYIELSVMRGRGKPKTTEVN